MTTDRAGSTIHPVGTVAGAGAGTLASMRTIPSSTAGMLLSDRPDLRAALAPHGRVVGARTEVDLGSAAGAHPALCRALGAYQSQNERLWAAVGAGRAAGAAYVVTRRTLAEHLQNTGKPRVDLREAMDDLLVLPGVGAAVEHAMSMAVDGEVLAVAVDVIGGDVSEPEAGVYVLDLPLSGEVAWPDTLGGPAVPWEVARRVRVTVRHARWRHRALRTLSKVQVFVDEMWADPAAARALLEAA